jgi:hypothetical protein
MATATEPTRAVRREVIGALIEQSWARPDKPRPVARPHVVLMVAVFAAIGAVVAGVVLQLIHPINLPKATTVPRPVSVPVFTAVTGWDCGEGADRGFDAAGRTSDWYTVADGGWASNGCHGTFAAIPMTGSKTDDDPNQFAVWWFKPASRLTQCSVMVYRPEPDRPQDSAASAAQFFVLAGPDGPRLAGFVVDETADPGSWAAVGSFPISPDGIAIQLVDRGVPAATGSRLAITQVKVRCTS